MSTTETQSITDTKLERIAFLSQSDSTKEFRCLMHHFNEESLKIRMLKSGVMANGEMTISEEGAVQGSICSPILANILAHYAIDQWFEEVVKTHCKGEVRLFRYCDDLCICCEYESDALRIKTALAKRLTK